MSELSYAQCVKVHDYNLSWNFVVKSKFSWTSFPEECFEDCDILGECFKLCLLSFSSSLLAARCDLVTYILF